MKVLIIQQKMIGDVLTSSILFELLKKHQPNYELHYLVNESTYPVVANHPYIDKFHIVTRNIERSKLEFFHFLKMIKAERYGIVIDVYSKYSSNLITLFSKAEVRISKYKWYTSFIYSHLIQESKSKQTHAGLAIENRIRMLQALGIPFEITKPKVYLTQNEIDQAKALLKSHGIDLSKTLCMVAILGSSPVKTLPYPQMAKIIDTIVETTGGQVLFNYIPKQYPEALKVYKHSKKSTQSHIHFEVYGKNLREFLALTHHCDALIGNEGGATNMAKALGKPTYTIFSPWIEKEAWNLFDDGVKNISVHLKDYKPELYKDISKLKEVKPKTSAFYEQLRLDLFKKELVAFLNNL